jgi:predicted Zn-dependent protease
VSIRWFDEFIMRQLSVFLAGICFSLMLGLPSIRAQVDRSSSKGQPAQILTEARSLLDAGKTEAAIDLLRNGSKNTADKSEISFLLGLAYHRKRDYIHAIE